MKQHLNSEQTAKLIELGFDKPNTPWYYDNGTPVLGGYIYSIGQLIEFIPDTGTDNWRDRQIFGTGVRYYGERIIFDFDDEPELIDNLFNLCVKLKEEGVI